MKKKGVGLSITPPKKECSDDKCPFHGRLGVRGRIFTGFVTSDKMARTVTVVWPRRLYVSKYERYEKKKSKIKAHNPECINAKKGDVVRIAETRPLSKTKHFVVIEVVGKESRKELLKEEALQEAEVVEKKKGIASEEAEEAKEARGDKKKSKSERK